MDKPTMRLLPQRALMDREFKRLAERDEAFLELLPTLRNADLVALIATKPERWRRYAAYLGKLP